MVVKVVKTKEEFDQELKNAGKKAVLVDFYADWCGPCRMIAPELEKISGEMSDVVFLKVNVDENTDVAEEYEISAMPTFLMFQNCKKVDTLVGANKAKLHEMIKKCGKDDCQGSSQQKQD